MRDCNVEGCSNPVINENKVCHYHYHMFKGCQHLRQQTTVSGTYVPVCELKGEKVLKNEICEDCQLRETKMKEYKEAQ